MRPIDADALMNVLVAVMDDYRANGEILKAKATMCAIKCLESKVVSPTLDLAPKWISVNDRLPEEGKSVLVHYVDGWMPVAHLFNGKWYQSGGETSWLSVTHWIPLPEPPKEE